MFYHHFVENVALPLSDSLTHSNFWRLSKQVQQRSNSQHELTRVQNLRLEALLKVAVETTEFWAARIDKANEEQSPQTRLQAISPVSKSEVEAGFPDLIINRTIDQADLRFAATRGTTQRMVCVHDFSKRESMRAAMVCTLRASGYRIGMPMVEIPPNICDTVCGDQGERDRGVWPHLAEMMKSRSFKRADSWRDLRGLVERQWIYRRKTYPPFAAHFGTSQPDGELDKYIDQLMHDRPHTLKGLTTYLYQIAKRILSRYDVRLSISIIRPLGSGATPSMIKTIESAFGGKYCNDYGSAELGPIAFSSGDSPGMQVFEDQFIVEVLDSNGKSVPDGQTGEIVITDLVNHAMPLIRYRVGDIGRIITADSRGERSAKHIEVKGRIHDSVCRPDNGLRVSSCEIAEALYAEPELDQFQLIEKRNQVLELTLVPKKFAELNEPKFKRIIERILGSEFKIRVRSARTILPEAGGKFRWVKSR